MRVRAAVLEPAADVGFRHEPDGLRQRLVERVRGGEWGRQETELRVRCAAMNRMTGLGMPQSYAA
jgi:hypothetical protein